MNANDMLSETIAFLKSTHSILFDVISVWNDYFLRSNSYKLMEVIKYFIGVSKICLCDAIHIHTFYVIAQIGYYNEPWWWFSTEVEEWPDSSCIYVYEWFIMLITFETFESKTVFNTLLFSSNLKLR